MLVLEANGVTKRYGSARGVQSIEFAVAEGEAFGFIGPNGAGKSTTIRMLLGLSRPDAGEIRLFGRPVRADAPELRRAVGYLPSEVSFPKELTGDQVLRATARAYGLELERTRARAYAERLQFDSSRSVKSYSLGNRKKLGIIAALLHEPKLLVLDEPTSGLDPLMQQQFFQILQERKAAGNTVFFSTHVLTEVERLCDRVAFIKDGEIRHVSAMSDIPGRSRLRISVTYSEEGDRIEAYGLREIDPNVEYRDGEHRFAANRDIHETLQLLARYPIRDIAIRKPTLEELFMQYYEQEGERI
ncbi:ABC transporter ATP-binding protein [Paenibacillus sp.]|uniref:ABC transporter ATP-binding protein n=1 Tax=Paenibacillus sp. TaxID=58172 RepID=UPI00281109FB|nr:ABC transporter ATP-binding protein [Paenibacillus sp.]